MEYLKSDKKRNVVFIVLVASLGYFVDIYDLVIFQLSRVPSFSGISVLMNRICIIDGEYILNMADGIIILLGGILWGYYRRPLWTY